MREGLPEFSLRVSRTPNFLSIVFALICLAIGILFVYLVIQKPDDPNYIQNPEYDNIESEVN